MSKPLYEQMIKLMEKQQQVLKSQLELLESIVEERKEKAKELDSVSLEKLLADLQEKSKGPQVADLPTKNMRVADLPR